MSRCESLRSHHKMHKSHQLFQPQLCLMLLSKPHLLTPHHPCCHQPGISYKRAEGKEILTLLLVPSTHCSTSAGNPAQQNPSTQDSFQASAGTHLSPQKQPSPPTATTRHCWRCVTRARPAQQQLHKFIQRYFCLTLSFPQKSDANETPWVWSLSEQPLLWTSQHRQLLNTSFSGWRKSNIYQKPVKPLQ